MSRLKNFAKIQKKSIRHFFYLQRYFFVVRVRLRKGLRLSKEIIVYMSLFASCLPSLKLIANIETESCHIERHSPALYKQKGRQKACMFHLSFCFLFATHHFVPFLRIGILNPQAIIFAYVVYFHQSS